MSATASQIAKLRRMTAEPSEETYSDEAMAEYIEAHPLLDELGNKPYEWDYGTTPPSKEANENWVSTYDLNAAAADIWDEKAAALVANGEVYEHDSAHLQAMRQVRYYRSRRAPKTIEMTPEYPGVGEELP